MISIGILGGKGRMGQAVGAAAPGLGVAIAGSAGRDGDLSMLIGSADVLVDFSAPAALAAHLDAARGAGTPIVIGTTGLSPADHAAIDAAARDIAVLQTGNTSLGVAVLARLVRQAAALGTDWDIELIEMHHRHKADAPSGTALMLGEAAAAGRGASLADLRVEDRDGVREPGAIGFASLRGGTIAGEHQVIFAGEGERLVLGHVAEDRAIFARGAIRAALWLTGQPAGRYRMDDVIGL